MKESNTLADDVTNISLRKDIWIYTKGQFTKESNIHAANANIKQLQGIILLNITGQYMKESITLRAMQQIFLSGYLHKTNEY